MNKSVYLLMVMSCWWGLACIESNPQPMPHGKNDVSAPADTVSAADATAGDMCEYEVVGEDMSIPDDLVSPDVPLVDVHTDVSDVEGEVADGSGEITDGLGEVTDGQGGTDDGVSEVNDSDGEIEEDDVPLLDVPGELDGDLLESIEDPGPDG